MKEHPSDVLVSTRMKWQLHNKYKAQTWSLSLIRWKCEASGRHQTVWGCSSQSHGPVCRSEVAGYRLVTCVDTCMPPGAPTCPSPTSKHLRKWSTAMHCWPGLLGVVFWSVVCKQWTLCHAILLQNLKL